MWVGVRGSMDRPHHRPPPIAKHGPDPQPLPIHRQESWVREEVPETVREMVPVTKRRTVQGPVSLPLSGFGPGFPWDEHRRLGHFCFWVIPRPPPPGSRRVGLEFDFVAQRIWVASGSPRYRNRTRCPGRQFCHQIARFYFSEILEAHGLSRSSLPQPVCAERCSSGCCVFVVAKIENSEGECSV